MRTIRSITALRALSIFVLALVVVACGGAASAPDGLDTVGGPVERPAAEAPDGGGIPSAAPAAPDGGEGVVDDGDGVGAPVDDAKIIRTGSIELEIGSMPTALATARDGIRAMGGYIGASQTWNEGDRPYATVTYRIPVDRWEDALDLLRSLNGQTSKVVAEQTQALEVTSTIVDIEARIKNLRASETALQEIASNAVRVSDVLEVQAQLTQVRGEIESLEAQLKDLEDRVAFATLTASYSVPVVAVTAAQEDWDPAKVVDQASASLIEVVQGLATAGIWFAIVWLPVLVVLAVVVAIVVWVVRRLGILGSRRHTGGGEVAAS